MSIDSAGYGDRMTDAAISTDDAATYASRFAGLADPTRVRLLHTVATSPNELGVGELAGLVGISQSTCSHHVRKLADLGLLELRHVATTTLVSIDAGGRAGFPHVADIAIGAISRRFLTTPPDDVVVRPLRRGDWTVVRRIYADGIATGNATFETAVPTRAALDEKWLRGHRWVAEVDGTVAGWAALAATSARECYSGVAENSVYVAPGYRGRRVGQALMHRLVTAADAGDIWTMQTSIFPENLPSIALHHAVGFRTLGIRRRIARLNGHWRDTVFLERRRTDYD